MTCFMIDIVSEISGGRDNISGRRFNQPIDQQDDIGEASTSHQSGEQQLHSLNQNNWTFYLTV